MLVFRKPPDKTIDPLYRGGLVVFIVAELSKGGINQKQFENAVAWIDDLGGSSAQQLKILRPTFSGSLPAGVPRNIPQARGSIEMDGTAIRLPRNTPPVGVRSELTSIKGKG